MSKHVSTGNMIRLIGGLVGSRDITTKDDTFIQSILHRTDEGRHTEELTDRQLNWIEDIYCRHFG